MNPNSAYYLSFDTGYPNAFDRDHGRTGSALMVHGTCSSRGCYAMTDEGIAEVYALARDAFGAGQRGFQFQAYPFRMTAQNLAKHRADPNMTFWRNLKEGSDNFEVTHREPKVAVCNGRYAFNTLEGCRPDPTVTAAVAAKDSEDRREVAELVAKGTPAVRVVYADGGGHETFRTAAAGNGVDPGSPFAILDTRPKHHLGDVSRPDALAEGAREIALDEGAAAKGRAGRRGDIALASVAATTEPAAEKRSTKVASTPRPSAPGGTTASSGDGATTPVKVASRTPDGKGSASTAASSAKGAPAGKAFAQRMGDGKATAATTTTTPPAVPTREASALPSLPRGFTRGAATVGPQAMAFKPVD